MMKGCVRSILRVEILIVANELKHLLIAKKWRSFFSHSKSSVCTFYLRNLSGLSRITRRSPYSFQNKKVHERFARLFEFLSKYNFTIASKPETSDQVADLLSRYGNEKCVWAKR